MTRIVGHVGTYNGVQFLPTTLFQVHKHLDEIVIIDGAFAGFLASGFFKTAGSTDGTKKIIEALDLECPVTWVDPPIKGWESHSHKRAAFFNYLKDDDWQYLINDDECPIGDIEGMFDDVLLDETHDVIFIQFIELCGQLSQITWKRNGITEVARLFRWNHQNPFLYGYCHIELTNALGVNFRSWNKTSMNKMKLVHLKRFRPPYTRDRDQSPANIYDVHVRGSKKITLAQ